MSMKIFQPAIFVYFTLTTTASTSTSELYLFAAALRSSIKTGGIYGIWFRKIVLLAFTIECVPANLGKTFN